jgi:hypothetical protein
MFGPTAMRWLAGVVVLLALPVLGVLRWHGKHHPAGLTLSLVVLIGFWVGVLVLLEWAGASDQNSKRARYGFLNIVIGSDGRVGTSKAVVLIWTTVFASALVLLSGMIVFGGLSATDAFGDGKNSDAYFLLLGGPYASAVLAKGIVSAQVAKDPSTKTSLATASGTAQPTSAVVAGDPSAKDVLTGDSGSLDLVDTQFSIFSLIAVLYFVGALASNVDKFAVGATKVITLPPIPSALVGLTSLAALTYVGNKATQSAGLRVVTFDPPKPRPGTPVVATLVNLPATATPNNVSVTIQSADGTTVDTRAPSSVNAPGGTVTFTAPAAGDYMVSFVAPDTYTSPSPLTVA